mmetsp:Transcript_45148/g.129513  ORF Transcript_45148/g.129513 Transcript_45148/m.129513 type:complete len:432 (+) Transcript_45148:2402-3697(+)
MGHEAGGPHEFFAAYRGGCALGLHVFPLLALRRRALRGLAGRDDDGRQTGPRSAMCRQRHGHGPIAPGGRHLRNLRHLLGRCRASGADLERRNRCCTAGPSRERRHRAPCRPLCGPGRGGEAEEGGHGRGCGGAQPGRQARGKATTAGGAAESHAAVDGRSATELHGGLGGRRGGQGGRGGGSGIVLRRLQGARRLGQAGVLAGARHSEQRAAANAAARRLRPRVSRREQLRPRHAQRVLHKAPGAPQGAEFAARHLQLDAAWKGLRALPDVPLHREHRLAHLARRAAVPGRRRRHCIRRIHLSQEARRQPQGPCRPRPPGPPAQGRRPPRTLRGDARRVRAAGAQHLCHLSGPCGSRRGCAADPRGHAPIAQLLAWGPGCRAALGRGAAGPRCQAPSPRGPRHRRRHRPGLGRGVPAPGPAAAARGKGGA